MDLQYPLKDVDVHVQERISLAVVLVLMVLFIVLPHDLGQAFVGADILIDQLLGMQMRAPVCIALECSFPLGVQDFARHRTHRDVDHSKFGHEAPCVMA